MSSRGSITLSELQGKLDLLEIKCHRCERHGRLSLARLIDEHGADKGLPDLWESRAGARSTADPAASNVMDAYKVAVQARLPTCESVKLISIE